MDVDIYYTTTKTNTAKYEYLRDMLDIDMLLRRQDG